MQVKGAVCPMVVEQTLRPYEPKPQDDPLLVLTMECMRRLLTSGAIYPIRWAVGDSWVEYGLNGWSIDADEPATAAQVRELVVRAGGVVELLEYE
jgi:hypothetical protein